MAVDINDLDDDDLMVDEPGQFIDQEVYNNFTPQDDPSNGNPDENNENNGNEHDGASSDEEDLISSLLARQGITDRSKIQFENEDGEIEELNWDSLSAEEKTRILSDQTPEEDDTELDDSEIDFINQLRLNNMTPEQYTKLVQEQAVMQYAQNLQNTQQPVYNYTVDDLSDEELFVLDLQARVPDITDDELADALDNEKENEELFKKKITGIREEYKQLEDQKNEREQALFQQQQQAQYEQFAGSVANQIEQFTSIGELDIDMDDNDMNELYNFITGYDQTGVSHFARAVNDPETLVKMAWFALRGEDVLNSISNYYKDEIKRAHRAGIEEGKKSSGKSSKKQPTVVIDKKPKEERVNNKQYKSIHDLDED